MTARRQARERALQFLFGLDFTQYECDEETLDLFWLMRPTRPVAKKYAERLITGICETRNALDDEIRGALTNWTPERVGRIEWNLIRIALYEMRHMHEVPPAVAINEAIEMAKDYGHDEAPRFINGILDRLRKPETAEPDND